MSDNNQNLEQVKKENQKSAQNASSGTTQSTGAMNNDDLQQAKQANQESARKAQQNSSNQ